MTTGVVTRVVT